MNELRRMAYLEAMGVDHYISRRQLPGAAVSRRLPIVTKVRASTPAGSLTTAEPVQSPVQAPPVQRIDQTGLVVRATKPPADEVRRPAALDTPRFSLVTLVAGAWLWMEELGDMPLTTEQVQLVQSMAYALLRCAGGDGAAAPARLRPDVLRFDWPMHNNHQLDLGEEAARVGIAAFVSRRVEQHHCRGVVLLGQACAQRVLPLSLDAPTVCTASSAEILQQPALKQTVWQDLQQLMRAA